MIFLLLRYHHESINLDGKIRIKKRPDSENKAF